jgi:hypothetical protein
MTVACTRISRFWVGLGAAESSQLLAGEGPGTSYAGCLMQPRSRSKQVGVMLVPDIASVAVTLRAGYWPRETDRDCVFAVGAGWPQMGRVDSR